MQKLELNLKAVSQNAYNNLHWAVKGDLKKEFEHAIFFKSKSDKLKPITKYPITIEYLFCIGDGRKHDVDNYAITVKFINDGLRLAGVIEEDDMEHIDTVILKAKRDEQDKIIIKIK